MVGALWTGISGLSGSQTALDNESNNIANVNTIGYKASRISFTDQMYQAKIGKGVTSFDVEKMYSQGSLKMTGVSYDMALSGDGFFVASNGRDTFFSRAGNFRMGEGGTLDDVAGNNIQGWAMQPIQEDNIVSTDPNATRFTKDFSKLLGNKVIKDTNSIETVIAKATDYTSTATSDSQSVFTGGGYKTASTKIADVEKLITEYNALLTTQSTADPKPTSSTSSVQKNYLNFNLDSIALATGDEMYMFIDGTKYTQSFDTDETTTLKKFVDVISNTAGFKAHYTDGIENNPTGTVKEDVYAFDNAASTNPKGGIYIEGLIPGKQFRITEFGWTDASNSNQAIKGEVKTIKDAIMGTGMGAINSVENALAQAISGKQQDVYGSEELILSSTVADNDFTYQINIYDKETKINQTVPATPLDMSDMTDINAMVTAINTVTASTGKATNSELAYYVKAYNINGNLVVKTLDANNDIEFTGELKGPIPEQQTVKITGKVDLTEHQTVGITGTATAQVTFLGTAISGSVSGDTAEQTIDKIIADKANLMSTWNAAHDTVEIEDIIKDSAGVVQLVYKHSEGNVAAKAAENNNGITIAAATDDVQVYTSNGGNVGDGGNTEPFSFLGAKIANIAHGDSTSTVVEKIISDKTNVIAVWNAANPTKEISDIIKLSADELKIIYKNTEGDVVNTSEEQGYNTGNASYGVKFNASEEIVKGELKGLIAKNANYSGREGTGAEFLKISTMIDQTASKGNLQLRLDTLNLTDSAFGDFSVDGSGVITMKQDGVDFAIGQLATARFTNNRGLDPIGNNLYKATNNSGSALYKSNNYETAKINGGSLELSTADLSESLVNLMVFQRAFEANAKSITTADQILTTLIQLKR